MGGEKEGEKLVFVYMVYFHLRGIYTVLVWCWCFFQFRLNIKKVQVQLLFSFLLSLKCGNIYMVEKN